MSTAVTISGAGAHAAAAATDRIPASKTPFTPGTKGYLTPVLLGQYLNLNMSGTDTLEMRNGTTAQTVWVYNTYANAGVDYERAGLKWPTADIVALTAEVGGTGAAPIFRWNTGGVDWLAIGCATAAAGGAIWNVNTNGHILTGTDNLYDIGASGATRPRTGYYGTSLVAPTINATTGFQVNGTAQPAAGITTIASASLPAAATVTISSIPATYSYLVLQVTGWSQNTNTTSLRVRVGTSSADSTTTNYVGLSVTTTTNAALATADCAATSATQTTAQTGSATITFTGYHAGPHHQFCSRVLTNTTVAVVHGCYIGATTAIDTIEIGTNAAGNFDAGTYALYGVA